MVAEATGADEYLTPWRSDRSSRELFDEEFESENEDEKVEVEYESDGVQIIEQYGQDDEWRGSRWNLYFDDRILSLEQLILY